MSCLFSWSVLFNDFGMVFKKWSFFSLFLLLLVTRVHKSHLHWILIYQSHAAGHEIFIYVNIEVKQRRRLTHLIHFSLPSYSSQNQKCGVFQSDKTSFVFEQKKTFFAKVTKILRCTVAISVQDHPTFRYMCYHWNF